MMNFKNWLEGNQPKRSFFGKLFGKVDPQVIYQRWKVIQDKNPQFGTPEFKQAKELFDQLLDLKWNFYEDNLEREKRGEINLWAFYNNLPSNYLASARQERQSDNSAQGGPNYR